MEAVIWEVKCGQCGEYILTDQHINGIPYFDVCECGGYGGGDYRISDEPHPSVWG